MKVISALLLSLLLLPACAQTPVDHPTAVVGRVVVVLLDGTDLKDWQSADAPNLRTLIDSGSVALINTRTGETGSRPCEARRADAYATFGESSRTTSPLKVESAFAAALIAARIQTGIVGLLDTPDIRELTPLVTHPRSIAFAGVADASLPGGARTDYRLLDRQVRAHATDGLLFVDIGETARADCLAPAAGRDRAVALALHRADAAIGRLRSHLKATDRLVVMSVASPISKQKGGSFLGAIAIGGSAPQGTLTSSTSRHAGVVSLIDVAPSILGWLRVKVPSEMQGSSLEFRPRAGATKDVLKLQNDLETSLRQRSPLERGFIASSLALVIASILALGLLKGARALLLLAASGPAALLLLPLYGVHSRSTAFALAAVTAVALATIALAIFKENGLEALCWATLALVLVSMLPGNPIALRSPLSYSLALGDRFFGIGNDMMGVTIGCLLIASAKAWDRSRRARSTVPVLLFAVIFLMAAPWVGAKFGAVLAGVPAAVLFLDVSRGRLRRARTTIKAAVAAAIAAGIIVGLDLLGPSGGRSHVGRSVAGTGSLGSTIHRKITAALNLLGGSFWLAMFLIFVALVAGLLWRRRDLRERTRVGPAGIRAGLAAAALAALLAIVFNDAGLVAAVFIVLFGTVALLDTGLPEGGR